MLIIRLFHTQKKKKKEKANRPYRQSWTVRHFRYFFKHSRIYIQIKSSILDEESQSQLSDGILSDISIDGCAFFGGSIADCKVGKRYQIQIQFSPTHLSESVPIMVKSIVDADAEKKKYGFSFDIEDKKTSDFIHETLFHHLSN